MRSRRNRGGGGRLQKNIGYLAVRAAELNVGVLPHSTIDKLRFLFTKAGYPTEIDLKSMKQCTT
jgi:hypothetical protein